MKIACLVLWLIVFVVNTISACMGNDPNWLLVYCPLIAILLRYTADIIEEYT